MNSFIQLTQTELVKINGGKEKDWKNYPKPWYASSNIPPRGYYDMWNVYGPWRPPSNPLPWIDM